MLVQKTLIRSACAGGDAWVVFPQAAVENLYGVKYIRLLKYAKHPRFSVESRHNIEHATRANVRSQI